MVQVLLKLCFMPHTEDACPFYRDVMQRLKQANIPFALGGAYAYAHYTGIHRDTKDLDLFVMRQDLQRVLDLCENMGAHGEVTFPHWLAKVYSADRKDFVDLIFNSGNGLSPVDRGFFEHAESTSAFGIEVAVCPPEEIIWTKAFVMERERYDGADIAHLLHLLSYRLDWQRLLARFGAHWRLLLVHLILLGYMYPQEKLGVPAWVMQALLTRLVRESRVRASGDPVCGGTLVSREQYLVDVTRWGYVDGRLAAGAMTEEEIEAWTRAIGDLP